MAGQGNPGESHGTTASLGPYRTMLVSMCETKRVGESSSKRRRGRADRSGSMPLMKEPTGRGPCLSWENRPAGFLWMSIATLCHRLARFSMTGSLHTESVVGVPTCP